MLFCTVMGTKWQLIQGVFVWIAWLWIGENCVVAHCVFWIGSERLWLWGIGHLRYCFGKEDIFWFVFILCFGLHCLEMERNEKGY